MSPVSLSLTGLSRVCLAARAMLMKADIMLLDEPTNHLDVRNVSWLVDYLTNLPQARNVAAAPHHALLPSMLQLYPVSLHGQ